MGIARKLVAEFLGTCWLVLGGCGSAVLAAAVPNLGIGYEGVALAFGLTLVTGAYAFGHISGAHFNPAVTLGLSAAGRFSWRDLLPYWIAQIAGSMVAATILYAIASGAVGFDPASGFANDSYGEHSPHGYSLLACLVCEIAMTFMFLLVVLGATSQRAPLGFAPLAIGLAYTLIYLVSLPVTGGSANPARATGVALYQGSWAVGQLWLFWLAPLAGALLAGFVHRWLAPGESQASVTEM